VSRKGDAFSGHDCVWAQGLSSRAVFDVEIAMPAVAVGQIQSRLEFGSRQTWHEFPSPSFIDYYPILFSPV